MTDSIEDVLGPGTVPDDPFGTGSLETAGYEPFSFTVKRLVLSSLADKAIPVVSSRDVSPVLKNFLVQVGPGHLRLAATDLELAVLARSPAVTADSDHVLLLPARRLLSILREAPGDDVSVDVSGNFAAIRSGTARWDLPLDDVSVYPSLPDLAEADMHPVSRESFLAALKSVRYAVCRDTGRFSLMQVDIKLTGEAGSTPATVTASDGVRFARTVLPEFPLGMQIPYGALDILVKILEGSGQDEVQAGDTGSHLAFRVGGTVFLAARMVSRFPDVEKQILRPALENKLLLTVDRAELVAAIRRVRVNADPDTSAVGLRMSPETLTVLARDKDGNAAEDAISAGWDGPERLVVVNHQFLSDMLAVYPSAVCRFWLGPEKGKRRSVLMLRDDETGMMGIIYQMIAAQVGYGE